MKETNLVLKFLFLTLIGVFLDFNLLVARHISYHPGQYFRQILEIK